MVYNIGKVGIVFVFFSFFENINSLAEIKSQKSF